MVIGDREHIKSFYSTPFTIHSLTTNPLLIYLWLQDHPISGGLRLGNPIQIDPANLEFQSTYLHTLSEIIILPLKNYGVFFGNKALTFGAQRPH